jgi:hypothetical protein
MIQQSHSRGFSQRNATRVTPEAPAHPHLLQHYSQQPRCPITDKRIKKMWYLYTMEFYSTMKKKEILSFSSKWMEMENNILSEVSQAQKTKTRIFSLI